MGAGESKQTMNYIRQLVYMGNPACTRSNCHGRGITESGDHYLVDICECVAEGFVPAGRGMMGWQEHFDDFCEHVTGWAWEQQTLLTLYEMAHWGCKQCKVDELEEKLLDELSHSDELDTLIINRNRSQ